MVTKSVLSNCLVINSPTVTDTSRHQGLEPMEPAIGDIFLFAFPKMLFDDQGDTLFCRIGGTGYDGGSSNRERHVKWVERTVREL